MQVVIEINEDLYNHVKSSYRTGIGTKAGVDLGFAVAKGKPLPKGHGDLKDKKDMCCKNCVGCEFTHTCEIYSAPTIIKADREKEDKNE